MNVSEITAEPLISIGILHASQIHFVLHQPYSVNGQTAEGEQTVRLKDNRIEWQGETFDSLEFFPSSLAATFTLRSVEIGIRFHWQRYEDETFEGRLRFIIDEGQICAVNELPTERYLLGVATSEMKATAPLAYVKAQVVIARSWLFTQRRTTHQAYDVCADDHCQRYQGLGRQTNPTARQAVTETRGQVLTYHDEICDARYSKCCGGISEIFSTCWEDRHIPYLQSELCAKQGTPPDVSAETDAQRWIDASPHVCCNLTDTAILRHIVNDYDQETTDFFRWTVTYTTSELSRIVNAHLAHPIGEVQQLIPLHRGPSGRISLLRIVGSDGSVEIGKELAIRKVLSITHLKSSAFYVEKNESGFILHGAGWGHGVGLCQIGAAVMAQDPTVDYRHILQHYYRGSQIQSCYE